MINVLWPSFILLCSSITVWANFYEYFSQPESWHEASRTCRLIGKSLINMKPTYVKRLTDNFANMSLWQYGLEAVYFWSVHRVKKSSVDMYAESDDDYFPYDNRLADDDELYCAVAVFYVNVNTTRWIAEPCDSSYGFYCQKTLPFREGSISVLYNIMVEWNTANRHCLEEGGNLTAFDFLQAIGYTSFFQFDTSVWQPFNQYAFWTRNKRLNASTESQIWPIPDLDATMTSNHCVIGDTLKDDAFWSTDDCENLHIFICDMPVPTEDFYYFFEIYGQSLSLENNPFLAIISNSIASPKECEEICREENKDGLECTSFEVNHTSGLCTTHVQYTDINSEELFKKQQIVSTLDTSIYDLHYIQAILGNSTQKTSTDKSITELMTFTTSEQLPGENGTIANNLTGTLETHLFQQSTTSYKNATVELGNVSNSNKPVIKGDAGTGSHLLLWLLAGFGAVCTFVASTWLGIIIKRSKDKQKIQPVELTPADENDWTGSYTTSGRPRSF